MGCAAVDRWRALGGLSLGAVAACAVGILAALYQPSVVTGRAVALWR